MELSIQEKYFRKVDLYKEQETCERKNRQTRRQVWGVEVQRQGYKESTSQLDALFASPLSQTFSKSSEVSK